MWYSFVSETHHAILCLGLCRVGLAFVSKRVKSQETRKDACHPDKADYNAYQMHADNHGHNTNGAAVKITQSFSTIKRILGDEKIVFDGTNSHGQFFACHEFTKLHARNIWSTSPEIL